MKTPEQFDYDLWTTEDGKYMVRVKRTGEVTEVSHEVMKLLRSEEKKLKREMEGVPIEGADGEKAHILSLDYISLDNNTEGTLGMEPWWFIDKKSNPETIVIFNEMQKVFVESLSPKQSNVYCECICGDLSLREYARKNKRNKNAPREAKKGIEKKYMKVFMSDD